MSVAVLRKLQLEVATLQDNAASFVNQTSDRLHIRKIILTMLQGDSASVLGDVAVASIDEVPVGQQDILDTRSHIVQVQIAVIGGTGAIVAPTDRAVISFNRNDLVLDVDEALFLNTTDTTGAPSTRTSAQFFYED